MEMGLATFVVFWCYGVTGRGYTHTLPQVRTPSSSHTAKHVVDVWLGKLIAIVIADPRKVGSVMERIAQLGTA